MCCIHVQPGEALDVDAMQTVAMWIQALAYIFGLMAKYSESSSSSKSILPRKLSWRGQKEIATWVDS